jgi:putative peptide zinc metalloprotease protein
VPLADHCAFPPRLAPDVEISERTESQTPSYIAGSASVGRYLMLGLRERRVLELLDGARHPYEIIGELAGVDLAGLSRFLEKLDDVGILAGERSGRLRQAMLPGGEYYRRWTLFHPDAFFGALLPALRWIWTASFFRISAASIAFACLLAVLDWPEFARYSALSLRSDYFAILLAAWFVTAVHEFSHGLTAKAFGGRSNEVGFMLIYYVLPAFYCEVSAVHLISRRGRRLWVIAAGIYSQLLLGFGAVLVWFVFDPETWFARMAMALALASLLDLLVNANPLIKLDGYYFLSQWLGMPNLMDRSRACWRDVGRNLVMGLPPREAARFQGRERRILLVFGFFSLVYSLGLRVAILWYASRYLMDWFEFPGLLLTAALAVVFFANPLRKTTEFWFGKENRMAANESAPSRRRLIPAGITVLLLICLLMPWTASVGSYGTLVAIPGHESIIRAPESATLLVLSVQPGQQVAAGASLAQTGNLDMDEQLAGARADLARLSSDAERLAGDLRVQQEARNTAQWLLAQRRREFGDVDREEQQIRLHSQSNRTRAPLVRPAFVQSGALEPLPPALAALEAETSRLEAQATETESRLQRARLLAEHGSQSRGQLEAAESAAASASSELAGARERLEAALIDHERRHASAQTESNVAATRLSEAEAQAASLEQQLAGGARLRESLTAKLTVLERKRAQFAIAAPVTGTVFGDDLPRMLGQYLPKGSEICRVADVRLGHCSISVPSHLPMG